MNDLRSPDQSTPTRALGFRRRGLRWTALVLLSLGGWAAGESIGLTAAGLFSALIVAATLAVTGWGPSRVPRPLGKLAQGVLASAVGLMVHRETIAALGSLWVPVVSIAAATLAISVAAGALLALHRDVDAVTGSLSMTAGGATGLVAMARELGGDDRVVAVVQYLRVALVVLTMPMIVTFGFRADTGADTVPDAGGGSEWYVAAAFLALFIVGGTAVASLVRLPAPATLGPLAVSAGFELGGWSDAVTVPPMLMTAALILIGWQAGLAFDRASLRAIGRILPYAAALTLLVGAACAGLGVLLAHLTGASLLEAYLATTPGGLAAVLAVSASTSSNVTFVAAAQVLRLVIMLVTTPIMAKVFAHFGSRRRRRAYETPTVRSGDTAEPGTSRSPRSR
ncbi:AbrB family transcriptional regulator [Rhodococcus sp. NPDC056960]|uniref:AbrB family transcriptional regulator n=1 Tax=Rhodococcus sp. NPDC056960 TaxID=3345982 RepID=UPI00363E2024